MTEHPGGSTKIAKAVSGVGIVLVLTLFTNKPLLLLLAPLWFFSWLHVYSRDQAAYEKHVKEWNDKQKPPTPKVYR